MDIKMNIKCTSYVNSLHVFILANITEKQEWLETSCTIMTMISDRKQKTMLRLEK